MGTSRKRNFLHPILLVSLVLVSGVAADKCKSGCHGYKSPLLKYEAGQTYKYNFNGVVSVLLAGSESQETSLTITSDVLVSQLANCNQLLRLENLQITGRDAKKYGTLDDISKPVRFNFNDGLVDPQICTESGDSQNSLNIKRAIISLLQSTAHQRSETDVFGSCPTNFITKREKNILNIIKKRNLNQCEHREAVQQGFLTTHVNPNAEVKSSPFLSGDYTCEQRIKDNIIDHVLLTEEYHYKPFSTDQTGARAKSVSRLTFKGKSGGAAQAGKASTPRSIIFENPHMQTSHNSNAQKVLSVLKSTVSSLENTVGPSSARQFTDLIRIIRATNKNDLLTAYSQASSGAGYTDKTRPKKVYFDALVRAGTGESVEALVELINQFDGLQKKLVYISLAHTRHVTPESLTSVAKLVNKADAPRELLLSAGIVASHYCREHGCEGDVLKPITEALLRKIGNCVPRGRKEEDVAIAALKGLNNIQHLTATAVNKLVSCISSEAPARVRVAAITTIQASPCDSKLISVATEILQNRQLDSELRLEAYLALVQCPTGSLANTIKQLLDSETVNQVGSFITSHLRNLRASTNPERESARQHLSLVRSTKKFPVDLRKYSFNNELSYSVESLGIGASADSNVIYSQKSFLPRSGSLNLTGEVFGQQLNLLEINARQENLDLVVEHYLGPKGVLKNISPFDVFLKANETVEALLDRARQRFEGVRQKRATRQEIDEFAKKKPSFAADLDFDLGVKMFGSEFLFLSLGDAAISSPSGILDKAFDLLEDGLYKAKKFNYEINHNCMFLDAEVAYPTGTGLSLKLTAIGTASVELAAAGKIDIPQIIRDPSNAKLELKLIPSANVEIVGSLSVDAQIVSTGLQIVGSLHTSTGSDITVSVLNGKGIDIKFGLPLEKQEVFTVGHDILFSTQERGSPAVLKDLQFKSEEKDWHGCFDQLKEYIGVTFCGEVRFAIPKLGAPFPLNGPSKVSLRIDKENLKEYHIKALYSDDVPTKRSFVLLFDATGGETSREITLNAEYEMDAAIKYVQVQLKAPQQSAAVRAELITTEKEVSASASVKLNDNELYKAKIGAQISGSVNRKVYKPILEYKTPEGPGDTLVSVTGDIIVETKKDGSVYNFNNVKLVIKDQPAGVITGTVTRAAGEASVNLKLSQGNQYYELKGQAISKESLMKLTDCIFISSEHPEINVKLNAYYEHHDTPSEKFEFILVHGADFNSKENRVYLYRGFRRIMTPEVGSEAFFKYTATYPVAGIEIHLDSRVTDDTFEYDLKAEHFKGKVASKLVATVGPKDTYDIEFNAKVNDYSMEVEAKKEQNEQDRIKLSHSLQVVVGDKYEVSSVILLKTLTKDFDTTGEFELKLPGNKNYKATVGAVVNDKVLNSAAQIQFGKVKVVEFDLKINRDANGKLKIVIKDIVNANGAFNVKNGKGSGSFDLVIIELDRKIKSTVVFVLAAPNYDVDLNVLYNAEKDDSQKIHFSTKNHVTEKNVESKSVLDVNTYKTEFNLKGNKEGHLTNGVISGQFDLTLPNSNYIEGNIKRNIKSNGDITNGDLDGYLSFAKTKTAKPNKLKIVAKLVNLNKKTSTFDISHDILLTKSDGKTVSLKSSLKHLLGNEDKHTFENQIEISGSLLPEPLGYSVKLTLGKLFINYDLDAHRGSGTKVNLNGNVAFGNVEKVNILKLSITLPYEKVQSIQFSTESSLKHNKQVLQFVTKNVAKLNNVPVQIDADLSGNPQDGLSGTIKYQLHNEKPFTLGGSYTHVVSKEQTTGSGTVKAIYGDNKQVSVTGSLQFSADSALDLKLNVITPIEHANNIDLHLIHKKFNDGNSIQTEVVVAADKQKYSLLSAVAVSETTPYFDVRLTLPNNKIYHITATVQKFGERRFTADAKVDSPQFNFDGALDYNLEDVDNFSIKLNIDSAELKLTQVVVNIVSKAAKAGKRIEFSAKTVDKNIFSGSTTYQVREEGSKLIVEGQGQVLVKEEKRNANFKFIRNNLQESDERGILVDLTANFGSQQFVGETKLTNKRFLIKNSYCEEKKQCAHIELSSELKHADLTELDHVLEISVDLRKLGLTHEFGLKASTKRQGINLDHTVDMHFHSQDKPKYQYSLYFKPKEAGIILTLPQRTVSIEGTLELPKPNTLGPLNAKVEVYLNKLREPKQKASLFLESDVNKRKDDSLTLRFKSGFNHPAIRELAVSGNVNIDSKANGQVNIELDIFNKKSQQIVINGKYDNSIQKQGYNGTTEISISSQGLNIDTLLNGHVGVSEEGVSSGLRLSCRRERQNNVAEVLLVANRQQIELLIRAPFVDIIHLDTKYALSKEKLFADTKLVVLGNKELVIQSSINDFKELGIEVFRKENPSNRISVHGELVIDQIAKLEANVVKGQEKKNLFSIKVHLDKAKLLQTDVSSSSDNIKALLERIRQDASDDFERVKAVSQKATEEAQNRIQKYPEQFQESLPNFKPVVESYQRQLESLKQELLTDKTIKEIADFLEKIFGAAIRTLNEIFVTVSQSLEKATSQAKEIYERVSQTLNENILPQVRASYNEVVAVFVDIAKSVVTEVTYIFEKLVEYLKSHEEEFKKIANTILKHFQGIFSSIGEIVLKIKDEVTDLLTLVLDQIKTMPAISMLKEQYNEFFGEFNVPEQVFSVINDVFAALMDVLPTPELRDFVGKSYDYLVLKLKKEKVDDIAEIRQIYDLLIKAVKSVILLIQSQTTGENIPTGSLPLSIPFSFDGIKKLPSLISIKLSPLNLLRLSEWPTIQNILTYRPTSLNPLSVLPPFLMTGYIADGEHIFTFDGRHLTFSGSCDYVLAHDYVDKNFTIVATLLEGKMQAITLIDKENVIRIAHDSTVKVNGKPADFPVITTDTFAWREFHTIGIASNYGAKLRCSVDLRLCSFEVSGFYLGKVHGILGDGNGEPFDDFRLPSGQITTSESDFGNAYKLTPSCPNTETVDHSHHHSKSSPLCSEIFAGDSLLRPCFFFVDPAPYRQACEHAVGISKDKNDAGCNIAHLYTIACWNNLVPVSAPTQCGKCEAVAGKKDVTVGDIFSVKSPTKQADIVFVVGTDTENAEVIKHLIHPLINQLANDLKKPVPDTRITVIGYDSEHYYPAIYTTNGKLNFRGKEGSIKVAKPETNSYTDSQRETASFRAGNVAKVVANIMDYELGLDSATRAYNLALQYPFRAGAAKIVIGVHAETFPNRILPLQDLKILIANKVYQLKGITFNLISSLDSIALTGNDKSAQVVGFNANSVFLVSDARKKPDGNPELRSKLSFDYDAAASFAQTVNGNIYTSSNFLKLAAPQRKQFLNVMSGSIVEQVTRTEVQQDCTCAYNSGIFPETICMAQDKKILPAKKGKPGQRG